LFFIFSNCTASQTKQRYVQDLNQISSWVLYFWSFSLSCRALQSSRVGYDVRNVPDCCGSHRVRLWVLQPCWV